MAKYTEEQIRRANSVDLVDMLKRQGEILKRVGHDYRWMRYDSTTICGDEWFRHSKQIGGHAVDFMIEFYGMSFRNAVETLLNGEKASNFVESKSKEKIKKLFILPNANKDMHRVYAYLNKTRGIDADVITHFVHSKKIYESDRHNIVFVGTDENGVAKQAHIKSTLTDSKYRQDVTGSNKKYGFHHNGNSNTIYVFESPIDMLSFICLNKDDWKQHSYIALGGVSAEPLMYFIETNENIDTIYFCLDNDNVGRSAAQRIINIISQEYICKTLVPKDKDWNDDLKNTGCQSEMAMGGCEYEGDTDISACYFMWHNV